jgi:hypothetical protein
MFTKKIYLIFFFLILAICSQSQVKIAGKVIDAQSKDVVLYATVYLPNQNTGTITNEEGDFSIYISDSSKNQYLKFSCIGYQSKSLSITQILNNNIIALHPADYMLESVNIAAYSERKIDEELSKIIKKYRSQTKQKNAKVFCDIQSQEMDGELLEIIEAFYSGKTSLCNGIDEVTLKNGRIGVNMTSSDLFLNLNTTDFLCSYKLFRKGSLHGFIESPLQKTLGKIRTSYQLYDNGIFYEDDLTYREILFTSKEIGKCSGSILLNDTLVIIKAVRLQYENINSNFFTPLNQNDIVDSLNISIEYYYKIDQTNSNQMILERINLHYSCRYFQSASEKWRNIDCNTFLLCYDYEQPFEQSIFNQGTLSNDYMRIMAIPFNSMFWEINYFMPDNEATQKNIDFFRENGILLNYNEDFTAKAPFIQNHFLSWGEKRLQLNDFHNNNNKTKYNDSFNYQDHLNFTSDLYHFDIQIYLDYFNYKGSCGFITKTLFNTETSYCLLTWNLLTEMYINLYFDMYEVCRRRIVHQLDKMQIYDEEVILSIYNTEIEILKNQLNQYNKETKYGTLQIPLLEWESIIKDELREN